MHLAEASRNFWGGYAIVGSHIPIGAGMAYAMQYLQREQVVLDFLVTAPPGTGSSTRG